MTTSRILLRVLVLALACLIPTPLAIAQTPEIEALKAKLKRLEAEWEQLAAERERLKAEWEQSRLRLAEQELEHERASEMLAALRKAVEPLRDGLHAAQARIERLGEENETLKAEVDAARRARADQPALDVALEAFTRILDRDDLPPAIRGKVLEAVRASWGPERRGLPGILKTLDWLLEEPSASEEIRLVAVSVAGKLEATAAPLLPALERQEAAGSDRLRVACRRAREWIRACMAQAERG
ncbi:MAG: hypothetical protein JXQ29_16905 [Planctomycetes bacterium]|nr:hypothetical protein [Planctomycetota bacterium]